MAAATLGAYWLPPGYWTDLLQASAKAGLVGGLGRLVRRDGAVPPPAGAAYPAHGDHSARKGTAWQALGRFVSRHVVNKTEVTRMMGRFDVGAFAKLLLNDPAIVKPMARSLAAMMPRVLATVEDGRARRTIARLIPPHGGRPRRWGGWWRARCAAWWKAAGTRKC